MNNHQIKRRVYDSSSDDEDDEDQKSDHTPQRKTPKLQNSTSSVVGQKNFKGSGFLSKLESNSFWNDDDDADGEQHEDEQQSSTKAKQGSSCIGSRVAAFPLLYVSEYWEALRNSSLHFSCCFFLLS